MGDIGIYVFNMVEFVIGSKVIYLCVDLYMYILGCCFDDDGVVFFKFDNNVLGVFIVSQVVVGEENGLKICVYGDKGGLEWFQMCLDLLIVCLFDKLMIILCGGQG